VGLPAESAIAVSEALEEDRPKVPIAQNHWPSKSLAFKITGLQNHWPSKVLVFKSASGMKKAAKDALLYPLQPLGCIDASYYTDVP